MIINGVNVVELIELLDNMNAELDKIGAKYDYDVNMMNDEDRDRCAILVAGIRKFEQQLDEIEKCLEV